MRRESNNKQIIRIITIFLCALLIVALMPLQPKAAIKKSKSKKAKAKYSVSIENINADTVIKRGSSIKVQYYATCQKGSKTSRAKVSFKSSNKKIATVSSKGVIKAKKNGTVKITVYCRRSPKKKQTVKIRVGTPVSKIEINGYQHLRAGRKTTVIARTNSDATNKKVIWTSDNPSVVNVDAYGNVSALKKGTATIYASAADGSGIRNSIRIGVYKLTKNDTRWIAHRGLHTSAIENTAEAFIAAGMAGGFWGCECDVWETKHEVIKADVQEQPELIETSTSDAAQTTEANSEMPQEITDEVLENVSAVSNGDKEEEVTGTNEITKEISDSDTEHIEAPDTTDMIRESAPETSIDNNPESQSVVETFDIVINHDNTFKRTFGKDVAVKSLTASEIRDQLPKACFFDKYLDICKQYNMVPVVEFKDPQMSEEAINRVIEMLEERGQLESALLISFYPEILEKAKACADGMLDGKTSHTAFLTGGRDIGTALSISKQKGFDCISSYFGYVDKKTYERCKAEGLSVGTWTYGNDLYSDEMLYTHLFSGQYMLDFATVDYKPW